MGLKGSASCLKIRELPLWEWLNIQTFISALSQVCWMPELWRQCSEKVQRAFVCVSTQIYTVCTYSINTSNRKSCPKKPSCRSEDPGLTAQFPSRKKYSFWDFIPATCVLENVPPLYFQWAFSPDTGIHALSLSQLKSQFKLVLWHTLIEDSVLGRKNCFQAQLSIDRLCAPPILSPLFATEFIFSKSFLRIQ